MTLAEKIEAVVREAFPCESEGKEACAYNFTEPMTGHDLMCPARFKHEALIACRRAANLAIEEAVELAVAYDKAQCSKLRLPADEMLLAMIRAAGRIEQGIRALALPEDKT